jgi:hypothetical protein
MGLETGVTIAQLDSAWPLGGDQKTQGDDHLRLIKSVLKTQFPGASGLGFNTPIIATESDLNTLPQLLLNRAAFKVTKTAIQTLPVANVLTNILFEQTNYDNKSSFAGQTSYTIAANLGGFWIFGCSLKAQIQPPGSIVGSIAMSLLKNNISVSTKTFNLNVTSQSLLLVSPEVAAVGDVFKIQAQCTSSQYAIEAGNGPSFETSFWGFKII